MARFFYDKNLMLSHNMVCKCLFFEKYKKMTVLSCVSEDWQVCFCRIREWSRIATTIVNNAP